MTGSGGILGGRWEPIANLASGARRLTFLLCAAWEGRAATLAQPGSDDGDLPVLSPSACVCIIDGSVSVSKAGKHGHAKCMMSVRKFGSSLRADVIAPGGTMVFVLDPERAPADVFDVVRGREEIVVMRQDTAEEVTCPVAGPPGLLDQLAAQCEADDVPSVEVLTFRAGAAFEWQVAVSVSVIAGGQAATPVQELGR
jgi:translation elongation factor P/translation initiation factor 5A